MAIFQKKKSTAYAVLQSAKGTAATITDASALQMVNDSSFVQPTGEQLDRGLITGGRWPSKQAVGGRWGEGSLVLEMHGSGTAGQQPTFGPLLETLLGSVYTNAADVVNGAGTTTTLTATAETFAVGQLIRVEIGSGYEVRRITAVSGFDITVQRAFSEAPADGAIIAAGVTYLHLGTEAEQYFTLDEYLDGLRLLCTDAVCESLSVSTSARQIIQGTFGLRSLSCAESVTDDPNTPAFDGQDPLIGTECNLVFDGSTLDMASLEFSLTTRRARGGINSTGYSELPFSGEFEATATMTPWVEDASPITGFFDGSTVNAEMTKGASAGNIMQIELAGLSRTGPEIGEDDGDFSWSDPFSITEAFTSGFSRPKAKGNRTQKERKKHDKGGLRSKAFRFNQKTGVKVLILNHAFSDFSAFSAAKDFDSKG